MSSLKKAGCSIVNRAMVDPGLAKRYNEALDQACRNLDDINLRAADKSQMTLLGNTNGEGRSTGKVCKVHVV